MHFFKRLIQILAAFVSISVANPIDTNTYIVKRIITPIVDIGNILSAHNQYRARHNSPPVNWNDDIASSAREWASNCMFEHSPYPFGENIAGRTQDWTRTITLWYNEEPDYNYDTPGFSEGTGHFTQIVWKNTQEIGCAVSYCDDMRGNFFVCEYQPSGNIVSGGSDPAVYFRTNVTRPEN